MDTVVFTAHLSKLRPRKVKQLTVQGTKLLILVGLRFGPKCGNRAQVTGVKVTMKEASWQTDCKALPTRVSCKIEERARTMQTSHKSSLP